jgi:hypothetical protein
MDSAIRPPPHRALGDYPLTIPQERVFIQLFRLRTSPVFYGDGLAPIASHITSPQTRTLRYAAPRLQRSRLNTYGEQRRFVLALIEKSFYRGWYALGPSAA